MMARAVGALALVALAGRSCAAAAAGAGAASDGSTAAPGAETGVGATQYCGQGGPPLMCDTCLRFANTSVTINASAEVVWDLLTGMGGWDEWNDVFTASVGGQDLQVGTMFTIGSHFRTAPAANFERTTVLFKLTVLEELEEVCWNAMGIPGIWGRHCFLLCTAQEGTLVYNYEDHRGMMASTTRQMMGNATTDGFNRFNDNLTSEAERRQAEFLI